MAIEKTTSERSYEEIFNEIFQEKFPAFKEEEYKIACEIRDKIKENIRTNYYNFKLSPKYQEWKDNQPNAGKVPLDLTRHYLDSINVVATETGYTVQIDDVMHQDIPGKGQNTMHMRELGQLLEYGDPDRTHPNGSPNPMPAFPHWRPVIYEYQENHGLIKDRFNNLISEIHELTIQKMNESVKRTTKL